jgi:hypothetical protein
MVAGCANYLSLASAGAKADGEAMTQFLGCGRSTASGENPGKKRGNPGVAKRPGQLSIDTKPDRMA